MTTIEKKNRPKKSKKNKILQNKYDDSHLIEEKMQLFDVYIRSEIPWESYHKGT
mgnify:CR=1 FL=1